ncbi:MAG: Rod shape-determining protein [Candidatus Nomurabacteria bacterium GW2011_GWA2_35_80]|uniref:Rod shape-determining protein n=1 Tax=Candidatus Nomurabacteria bacterium GW2011_GWA2_35_80 TaxID=1618733 RepID=A0A0G0D3M0_9BACT|nr:MAG: Rod shape-determining protein [Candidatus Nomurabacteria bacterium GW2011_GWA2_35_80]
MFRLPFNVYNLFMEISNGIEKIIKRIDWLLVFFVIPIILGGLFTMKSFTPQEDMINFFDKQIIWIILSFIIFFVFSFIDWFSFGVFSFQPADVMKLVLILILSKYFSRRHVEIRNIKHIFISGFYAFVPFVLVLIQPDFGSAIVIFLIWFGMVLVSGISKTHLFFVLLAGAIIFASLWVFAFAPYQKARVVSFLDPLADIHNSGYNASQSIIAVGSGQILGKNLGFGTQSRLKFLPEPQTDFIFAAYAEEWGFVGSSFILLLFGLVIWRILHSASLGVSNFEMLFGIGIAIFFMSHILINIGMNLGLMPITGIPLPFMSYGGSHLVTEFAGLGILMNMRKYARSAHRDDMKNEFLGI